MNSSSKENHYYQDYELVKDPFPVESFDNSVILTPQLNNRLDRIKSLITFSEKLVIVTAGKGGGKSVLADYVESIPEKNWKMCLIQANEVMDKEILACEIIQQVSPNKADDKIQTISLLHKFLEYSSKNEIVPVILIDDAHKLPIDTLEFVLELGALRYAESMFHFVLFADESITDDLEKERLADLMSALVYRINVPGLSMDQTKEYLDNRLSASGEINKYPFNDEDIEDIYIKSGGLPKSVNILAREIMQSRIDTGFSLSGRTQLIAGVGVIGVISIAIYFMVFMDNGVSSYNEINQSPITQVQSPAPAPAPDPAPSIETSVEEYVDEDIQAFTPEPDIDSEAMEDQVSTFDETEFVPETEDDLLAQQTTDDVLDTSDESTFDIEDEISITDTSEFQETNTEEIDETATIASNLPTAEQILQENLTESFISNEDTNSQTLDPEPVIAEDLRSQRADTIFNDDNVFKLDVIPDEVMGIKGYNWYREQARSSIVLQLISASDMSNVLNLLDGLTEFHEDMSGYIKYTPSGRPRYVLFFGLYAERQSAELSTIGIPAKLRAINPYPRSIGSIVDEIEEVGYWPR